MHVVLFPVFFMLFLGYLSRVRGWITPSQNEGAKKIVFSILFPILVFNVLVRSELKKEFLIQIFFLLAAWIIVLLIGKVVTSFTGKRFAHISPYLLLTCEGGNVALPLYISLVGASHAINIITFDVAGILINFGLLPVLITRQIQGKQGNLDWKNLIKKILRSSFIIAVLAGVIMNLSGIYVWVMDFGLQGLYDSTIEMIIKPITSIILFTLGYELKINQSMIKSLLRLSIVRFITCSAIVATFFIVFPNLMSQQNFKIAVLLYFMCPTGFPVPLQVQPLIRDREDESFMSAFISLFLIIALVAYTVITIFI